VVVFDRFTNRARRVVVLAQEEARNLDHNYIGTEHILLGLTREAEGRAAHALALCDVSMEGVRAQVLEIIGRGESAPGGHIPFTPRAKKVLELALREALELGHHHIGSEHILLGIVREGEGVAAQVLVKLGADLTRVRRAVGLWDSPGTAVLHGSVGVSMPARRGPAVLQQLPAAMHCVLCGRDLWDVERSVAGSGGSVCSECVAAAADALARTTDRETRLPPRASGSPTPSSEALAEIATAFEAGFSGDAEFVEGAEEIAHLGAAARERHPGVSAAFIVERVRLAADDEAEVRFVIHVTPMGLRIPSVGRARLIDGRWKIARETALQVWSMG
jgi:hypothetical protein